MQPLNRERLKEFKPLPEKIIQFGEGNFIRAFVDWMIHEMNQKGIFNGRVVAIQPTPHGKVVPKLNDQDGLYTVVLRGVMDGEAAIKKEIVSSISRGINPYEDWAEVLKVAEDEQVHIVFSNTTEAGLAYKKEDYHPEQSPDSYPGKLTAYLYHRYKSLGEQSGMFIIPCELLEGNGDLLKSIVLKIADDWALPEAFKNWIDTQNQFCNTLVDRIVTGYPKDEVSEFCEELGYDDKLLTVGEPYHLFAIDGDEAAQEALPFTKAGLNVRWGEVAAVRKIKTRVLNGAHTMMFTVGFAAGKETVHEMMEDESLKAFISKAVDQEILPILDGDPEEHQRFAEATLERFLNPYLKHNLLDIGLNSVFKFKSRLLQTLLDYEEKYHKLPKSIVFALASFLQLYRPRRIEGDYLIGSRSGEVFKVRDQQENIQFLNAIWQKNAAESEKLKVILSAQNIWGTNLNEIQGLTPLVCQYGEWIKKQGVKDALEQL